MTPEQYKAAIKKLGLSQERAGEWLGIGKRTSQGYALGEYPVPEPVARHIETVLDNLSYLHRRRKELLQMISQIDDRGLKIGSESGDETASWRTVLVDWLTEIESLLREHPSGLPPQI
jgi:hypothetical protein